jgi:hypothetical protein
MATVSARLPEDREGEDGWRSSRRTANETVHINFSPHLVHYRCGHLQSPTAAVNSFCGTFGQVCVKVSEQFAHTTLEDGKD